jgi:DNA-binding CsgD family transcriptional regulator/tetratricopeptide (TPR) repeat protein
MSVGSGSMAPVVRAGRTPGSRAPHLVGRTDQRARLSGVLDEVIADGSRFVLLGGDAGAGKTTVIDAFTADLFSTLADRKAQLVRGQCVPLGGDGLPYAPIVGTLRDLVAQHGREQVLEWAGAPAPALGVLLPDLTGAPPQGDSIRLQLFEAVTQLWERASEHAPLVVVVEDIHWADESTRHLLRFGARALSDAPVMIVASYRTDELTRRHPLRPFLAEIGRLPGAVRVDVPSLDRSEVAELLTRLMDRPPSNPVIDTVFRRSEGIPYFVEELTRSASRGCIDMPDTLRDALNVRVQALSAEAQHVVELAAVAGNRVEHELLAAAAGGATDELEQGLREAVDAAVLTADETGYGFRHALLREVVHDDLLPGQHARLHARFAALIEEHPELVSPGTAPLEIAHHWSAAHDVTKAFEWSITAARSGAAAYHETLKMYERAIELWDRVEDPVAIAGPRAKVLGQAAAAANDAGESERALALVKEVLAEAGPDGDPEGRIAALRLKGSLLFGLMRPGSVAAMNEAMALLPEDADPVLRVKVMEGLARQLLMSGEIAEGLRAARAAVAAAAHVEAPSAAANAHNSLAIALNATGAEAEADAEWQQAAVLARGSGTKTELRYFINHSDALHLTGRYADAVSQALAGIELARERGLERSMGSMLAGNAAEPLLALGQWSRAAAMIDRALELDPPANHTAHLRLLLAWLRVWRGELDEADVLLTEFRSIINADHPAPQYLMQAVRADAEHAMATGDPERAWRDVMVFLQAWDRQHAAYTYPVLAVGSAAAHALDVADGGSERTQRIAEFLDRALRINIRPLWEPLISAELADTADGWRRALGELSALPGPAHLSPYAGLRLAQHLVAGRERSEAREVISTASAQAAALGGRLLTDRLGALAQRAGLAPTAEVAASPLAGLTPREIEVLQLVAAGNSNGEIGSALFISTKTASVHVSNILAKLGVSGRGEAAALAYKLGLVPV